MKICLERITKSFEKKQVIRQTDLTIESGSFTTLLGPLRLRQNDAAAHDCGAGNAGFRRDLV